MKMKSFVKDKKGQFDPISLGIIVLIILAIIGLLFALKATLPYLIGIFLCLMGGIVAILMAKTGLLNKVTMFIVLILIGAGILMLFAPSMLGAWQNLTIMDWLRN